MIVLLNEMPISIRASMKRVLLICLALLSADCTKKTMGPTIEYQGEHFRLSKSFDDYDQYKEAADNIHPDEVARIGTKILSVPIAKEFRTKREFLQEALKIKFPGFGFGGLDSQENIHTATIEIPKQEAWRYVTAIEKDGGWYVVDDFKGPVAYGGTSVRIENGELIYKTHKGDEFRRKQLE